MASLWDRWLSATAGAWTSVQGAWTAATERFGAAVEADPGAAVARAQRVCDALWADGGAYDLLRAYDSTARRLIAEGREVELVEAQMRAAASRGVAPADLTPAAFQARLDETAAGILHPKPEVGFLPALAALGGWELVVLGSTAAVSVAASTGAVCWAWVRGGQVDADIQHLQLVNSLVDAGWSPVEIERVSAAAKPTSSSAAAAGSLGLGTLIVGGLAVAGVLAVARSLR